jgi:hypothetical protein
MPSTIAADVRGALKTALAPLAANIYDSVPESVIVPAIVCVPDSPYMELEFISKSTTRVKLNYTITACVAYSASFRYSLERPLRANRIGDPNANNSNNWARCDLHTRCSRL